MMKNLLVRNTEVPMSVVKTYSFSIDTKMGVLNFQSSESNDNTYVFDVSDDQDYTFATISVKEINDEMPKLQTMVNGVVDRFEKENGKCPSKYGEKPHVYDYLNVWT